MVWGQGVGGGCYHTQKQSLHVERPHQRDGQGSLWLRLRELGEEDGRRSGHSILHRLAVTVNDFGFHSQGNRKQLEFLKQGSNMRRSVF